MAVNVLIEGDGWRVPMYEELNYILNTRENATNLQGFATVNSINGVILCPDDFVVPSSITFVPKATKTGYTANVYTKEQWGLMEENGAIFFPITYNNYYALQDSLYGNGTNSFIILNASNFCVKRQNWAANTQRAVRLVYTDNEDTHTFSINAIDKIKFAKSNLQYRASDETWRFAENAYDTILSSNVNKSETYSGWCDVFGLFCTGWNDGRKRNKPYDFGGLEEEYRTFADTTISRFLDFGKYLCYLRDREESLCDTVWVRDPTCENGLTTLYVSKRGSDNYGDGTKEYPYASLSYVTSCCLSGCNIMIDDGVWSELVYNNNFYFNLFGNSNTVITSNIFPQANSTNYSCNYIKFVNDSSFSVIKITFRKSYNCLFYLMMPNCNTYEGFKHTNSIFIYSGTGKGGYGAGVDDVVRNCIFICCFPKAVGNGVATCYNTIFFEKTAFLDDYGVFINCNFTNTAIPTSQNSKDNINDEISEQTICDYFNYVTQSIVDNPLTADYEDWLKCDFTAKEGSYNIGKGEKGSTIGLNQGYTVYADNSDDDVWKESNGGVLRNVEYNSTIGGYILTHVDKVAVGGTSTTITLSNEASDVDDYYKGLFILISAGKSKDDLRYISSYNGSTKIATVSEAFTEVPDTTSVYSISGTMISGVKDLGKIIKVKQNHVFVDNMTALTNGLWSEYLTAGTTKQKSCSCFQWEYSIDNVNWNSGDELVSSINGNCKVCGSNIGDSSENFNAKTSHVVYIRYVKFKIHIGLNIGEI